MTITIELPDEAKTNLTDRANAEGVPLNDYVRAILVREAAHRAVAKAPERKRSRLSQMRGVGAEIWKDIGDAQEWINAQRDEWDEKK